MVYGAERVDNRALDVRLARVLKEAAFTGKIESTLERRLGRPINPKLANLGRLLWFDTLHSLHHDNTCGGCHWPTNGFGDSQGMAIGVQNNNLVGPDRAEPSPGWRMPFDIIWMSTNRLATTIPLLPAWLSTSSIVLDRSNRS
jgi:cytochrome c peroxidase